jgi:hypothetical protein
MWKRALFTTLVGVVAVGTPVATAQVPSRTDAGPAVPSSAVAATAVPGTLVLGARPIVATTFDPVGAPAGDATGPASLRAVSLERLMAPALPTRYRKPGVALMIVGGAGIVVGTLIDSGLITVAGAGVGLFGLYLYLR